MVLVAVRLKVRIKSTAVEEPKFILLESRKVFPPIDRCVDGVSVAIPRKRLVLSHINVELPEMVLASVQNDTWPLEPLPSIPPRLVAVRHEPPMAKQPSVTFNPLFNVEVAPLLN